MKTKIYNTLTKPYIVILVMLFAPLLNYFDRNFSYFFGVLIALLILWSSNYNWFLFSFSKKVTKRTVFKAFIFSVLLLIAFTPLDIILEQYFGEADVSFLEDIKHNTTGFIVMLVVIWVFAAFGEEFLFRGYYLKWLADVLGNTKKSWMISMVIVSIYFGLSHYYQGISGILGIIPLALVYSIIFYNNRDNLILLVFMHGFHDTILLFFLYLDIEDPLITWIQNMGIME